MGVWYWNGTAGFSVVVDGLGEVVVGAVVVFVSRFGLYTATFPPATRYCISPDPGGGSDFMNSNGTCNQPISCIIDVTGTILTLSGRLADFFKNI